MLFKAIFIVACIYGALAEEATNVPSLGDVKSPVNEDPSTPRLLFLTLLLPQEEDNEIKSHEVSVTLTKGVKEGLIWTDYLLNQGGEVLDIAKAEIIKGVEKVIKDYTSEK